ncbi:Ribosomal RNA small subunit methyltransferase A [Candidatus Magnetomoraceae bacterium gMMP-15]
MNSFKHQNPKIKLWDAKLRPQKKLGQNFISDPSIPELILKRSQIKPDSVILEIGAGLGALTFPLASSAQHVFAVEKDIHLINLLKKEILEQGINNVTLIERDILKLDIRALAKETGKSILVMGNLPYNISSQILIKLLKDRNIIDRAILMFQKEMARRLVSPPGQKDYGRLSVLVQYCADVKTLLTLGGSHFYPRVSIDSEVILIKFKDNFLCTACDEDFFFQVVKAGFGQRRKTLKNALAGSALPLDGDIAIKLLKQANIDPIRRAETLEVCEFVRLSNILFSAELIKDTQ